MNAVKELAYAKINLYLDIHDKMADGYHSISTVMHSVSLCDEVTVELLGIGKRGVRLIIPHNRFLPTDYRNLCVVAANIFMDRAGVDADILIRLKKRIPVGSGLGGGSADAAAVLRAMNRIFKRPFTERVLIDMATEIGSDVPFCLLCGTALCEGRGEIVTRIDTDLNLNFVIANSGEYVSTPNAYRELDSYYSDFDGSVVSPGKSIRSKVIEDIRLGHPSRDRLFNIFEAPILPGCPKAQSLKEDLIRLGAEMSMMSGSGSGVFGIFKSYEEALRARDCLCENGITAFYAKSVNNLKRTVNK